MDTNQKITLINALISSGVLAFAMFLFLNDKNDNPILVMLLIMSAFSAFTGWRNFNKARNNSNKK